MLAEIKRFHAVATRLLQTDADDQTLGAFLDRHGFSRYFVDSFMTPLVAAVWSSPPGEAMRYPARYLFLFLEHHGMLSVSARRRGARSRAALPTTSKPSRTGWTRCVQATR